MCIYGDDLTGKLSNGSALTEPIMLDVFGVKIDRWSMMISNFFSSLSFLMARLVWSQGRISVCLILERNCLFDPPLLRKLPHNMCSDSLPSLRIILRSTLTEVDER
jgi:hypothetical protein